MTEQEMFAAVDAVEGNVMVTCASHDLAMRYLVHRQRMRPASGLIAMCEDTRTETGICIMWRDPVKPAELNERVANCLWLLEETLAGRARRPGRILSGQDRRDQAGRDQRESETVVMRKAKTHQSILRL